MASEQDPEPMADAQTDQDYNQRAAAHIRELSNVNQQLPNLLRNSATAISLLTNTPVALPADQPINTPAERAAVISTTSYDLFMQLNKIRAVLLAQVDALHSEQVIPEKATRYIPPPSTKQFPQLSDADRRVIESKKDPEQGVTNGGLGGFDIAMLNANAGVREAGGEEVLDRVRAILEELIKKEEDGEEMVIDG